MLLRIGQMVSLLFLCPLFATAKQIVMGDVKVPVELGVMSRCPDALFCESIFNDAHSYRTRVWSDIMRWATSANWKLHWNAPREWAFSGMKLGRSLREVGEGASMLQKSVRASRELGIQKSCTILINKRKVCVHDGEWKSCKNGHKIRDFVKQIDQEYERLNKGHRLDYH
ncbi:hypothetical protein BD779DRAFT_1465690 [Infundibulicybe gibba]|nr:hypothetical protein BD779DRAFT_1465690 [Infundibulicybe gibba]